MKKTILSILVLSAFAFSCKNSSPATDAVTSSDSSLTNKHNVEEVEYSKGYKVGDVAEDFSLKNIDNKMVSLADFPDAKGFIITFTCNHCPYAIAYEDRTIALNNKYAALGYPVIAINPNDPEVQEADSFIEMQKRAKEKGFTFPYLMDEGQQIYPKYGATKTPHIYILNKENGQNIVKYVGTIDDNYDNPEDVSIKYVEKAVDALLAGQEIEIPYTLAIGCSIKTK